jgi:hypothetical protein
MPPPTAPARLPCEALLPPPASLPPPSGGGTEAAADGASGARGGIGRGGGCGGGGGVAGGGGGCRGGAGGPAHLGVRVHDERHLLARRSVAAALRVSVTNRHSRVHVNDGSAPLSRRAAPNAAAAAATADPAADPTAAVATGSGTPPSVVLMRRVVVVAVAVGPVLTVDAIVDAGRPASSALVARPRRLGVGVRGERGARRPDDVEQIQEALAMVKEHVQQAARQTLRASTSDSNRRHGRGFGKARPRASATICLAGEGRGRGQVDWFVRFSRRPHLRKIGLLDPLQQRRFIVEEHVEQ